MFDVCLRRCKHQTKVFLKFFELWYEKRTLIVSDRIFFKNLEIKKQESNCREAKRTYFK